MSVQPKPHYRFEDYLAVERESRDEKYEYVAGQVYAMTGASFNHNLITTNVIGELRNRLKHKPCSVLANDMRLRYDRGSKFGFYRTLPSLRHYVMIAQDRLGVDVFTRQADGHWLLEAYDGCPEADVALAAIGCTLPVSEIYANVDLNPLPEDQA
jgi:Uma2 family endonuclease